MPMLEARPVEGAELIAWTALDRGTTTLVGLVMGVWGAVDSGTEAIVVDGSASWVLTGVPIPPRSPLTPRVDPLVCPDSSFPVIEGAAGAVGVVCLS